MKFRNLLNTQKNSISLDKNTSSLKRNETLDAIKYILICLVVVGHFIEPTKYTNEITQYIYCLIYSFHMPLFVMISGYFYKQREVKEELQKCIPMLEICILSHIGFCLIQNHGNISLFNLVYFGVDPTWYLLSLIYWRMGTGLLLKRFSAKQILFFSITLDFVAFLCMIYGGILSIGRTIHLYPFFMLGYCMKNNLSFITQKYKKTFILLGLVSLGFILSTTSVLQFQIEFQRASLFELKQFTDIVTYKIIVYRYMLLACSLFISALVLIIVEKKSVIQRLSAFGQNTLFIYYTQTFMYAFISTMTISLKVSLTISFFVLPLLTWVSKWKGCRYLMNPLCSIARLK